MFCNSDDDDDVMHFMDMTSAQDPTGPASNSSEMPAAMQLNFWLGDGGVSLNLRRNVHVRHDVPFYTGAADDVRRIDYAGDEFALYHDISMKASIMVKRKPGAAVDGDINDMHEYVSNQGCKNVCLWMLCWCRK